MVAQTTSSAFNNPRICLVLSVVHSPALTAGMESGQYPEVVARPEACSAFLPLKLDHDHLFTFFNTFVSKKSCIVHFNRKSKKAVMLAT